VTTLASEMARVVRAVETGDPRASVSGCAPLGVLRVGAADAGAPALVETLRGVVGSHGGSVVVERGPRELRARVDPWGPVDAEVLGVMRGLKTRFDPTGVLNRGRFVGGL